MNLRVWMRKGHRWGAILIALPFLLVIVTGLLLQLKKQLPWVQPPSVRGSGRLPSISFEAILEAARAVDEGEISSWDEIERLDVQPGRGIVKVQSRNGWEIQVDLQTAEVLQVAYRRSDWLEALHDGSWFHDQAKLWIFFPSGLVVLALWISGIYLFVLPLWVKWNRKPIAPLHTEATLKK